MLLADFLAGLLNQKLPQRRPAAVQRPEKEEPFVAQNKPLSIARLFHYLETIIDNHIVLLADPGEAMFAAADLTIRHPAAFSVAPRCLKWVI